MRALVSDQDGSSLVLVERPTPVPGDHEILVRTRAVALNNADLAGAADGTIAGYEFSGVVAAVGEQVDPALVGRRVMGSTPRSFAEYVVAHHRHALELPTSMTFEDGAPLPTALLTEYGALRRAGVTLGDTVLITAATSGIALVGVQLAHVLGATAVIATTRSPERADLLRRAGADRVVVTSEEDLPTRVRELTAGEGADVVLDHVGGASLAIAVRAARRGGRVVSVGRLDGARAEIDLFELAAQHVTLSSVSFGFTPPDVIGDLLTGVQTDVLPAVSDGTVRAVVDSRYSLADAGDALARLRGGETEGKIVLTVA